MAVAVASEAAADTGVAVGVSTAAAAPSGASAADGQQDDQRDGKPGDASVTVDEFEDAAAGPTKEECRSTNVEDARNECTKWVGAE